MTDQPSNASKDSAVTKVGLTATDYAGIASFEDAMNLVQTKLGGVVVDASELGDGFAVLDNNDKGQLVGIPFVVLSVSFHESDKGKNNEFASLRVVTKDGRKLVINDGGSGIYEQLKTLYAVHPDRAADPIMVWNGLRESRYIHPEHGAAVTHYLDTSPAK